MLAIEAFILACSLTYNQALYVLKHEKEYNNRAVACAINRKKQEETKPKFKTMEDIPK